MFYTFLQRKHTSWYPGTPGSLTLIMYHVDFVKLSLWPPLVRGANFSKFWFKCAKPLTNTVFFYGQGIHTDIVMPYDATQLPDGYTGLSHHHPNILIFHEGGHLQMEGESSCHAINRVSWYKDHEKNCGKYLGHYLSFIAPAYFFPTHILILSSLNQTFKWH